MLDTENAAVKITTAVLDETEFTGNCGRWTLRGEHTKLEWKRYISMGTQSARLKVV